LLVCKTVAQLKSLDLLAPYKLITVIIIIIIIIITTTTTHSPSGGTSGYAVD